MLRNLQQDQAGEYFCKAQSDAGAVKSRVAQLTVIGKPVNVPESAPAPQGGPPQWPYLGSKSLGLSVLCIVLCPQGRKDLTVLNPILTELPVQEG